MQVEIHYHRPPNRTTIFRNELIHVASDVVVTYMPATPLPRPLTVNGKIVLEDGAPAVWFTFPGLSYDIGRFHTRAGEFTGLYANLLTPVEFVSDTEWRTTDLCVDVWIDADGNASVLDEDELEEAIMQGWIGADIGEAARRQAYALVDRFAQGTWPPAVVYDWPLERISGAT